MDISSRSLNCGPMLVNPQFRGQHSSILALVVFAYIGRNCSTFRISMTMLYSYYKTCNDLRVESQFSYSYVNMAMWDKLVLFLIYKVKLNFKWKLYIFHFYSIYFAKMHDNGFLRPLRGQQSRLRLGGSLGLLQISEKNICYCHPLKLKR